MASLLLKVATYRYRKGGRLMMVSYNNRQQHLKSVSKWTYGTVKQLKTINRFRGGLKVSAAPLCVGFMLYLQNLIVKSPFESLNF